MTDPKDWLLDFRETCLDVKEAIYSDSGLSNAFQMAGVSVEGFASSLRGMDVTMEDFVSGMQDFTSTVANGFDQMTAYGKTGLDEWEQNLRLNMAESQAYADNLVTVFNKIPEGIDIRSAFRKAVYEGGFDQWGQVIADMAEKSSDEIGEYIQLYNDALIEGQQSAIEQFQALSPGDDGEQPHRRNRGGQGAACRVHGRPAHRRHGHGGRGRPGRDLRNVHRSGPDQRVRL